MPKVNLKSEFRTQKVNLELTELYEKVNLEHRK